MVNSNERGRAFEYQIAIETELFIKSLNLGVNLSENTKRLNLKQKAYFDALDFETKNNFNLGAYAFVKWLGKQDWFKQAKSVTVDRVADNEAKTETRMIDLRLIVTDTNGKRVTQNFSIKNESDSLCHPRLPSLPEQCGIKDVQIDKKYFDSYTDTWLDFISKAKQSVPNALTYLELEEANPEFREKWLYKPLQMNIIKFFNGQKNNTSVASTFFSYLVGTNNYFVIKNTKKQIAIKRFFNIRKPSNFEVYYPYTDGKGKEHLTSCVLLFDNGWKIKFRVHTASSRLYTAKGNPNVTEKMDPICLNLKSQISIETISKQL